MMMMMMLIVIARRREIKFRRYSVNTVSIILDTVDVYVDAIRRLVAEQCDQDVTGGQCVTGRRLLPYLLSTNLSGRSGNISFDDNGDIRGRYEILNFRRVEETAYEARRVGVWDTTSETLDIDASQIIWSTTSTSSSSL